MIVYSIGNFPTIRCLDQIRNGLAYHQLKCLIVSNGAGYSYGQLGATHHATEDFGVMRSIPEVEIYVPAKTGDTDTLMSSWSDNCRSVGFMRLDKQWLSGIDFSETVEVVYKDDYTLIKRGDDSQKLNVVIGGLCSEINRCGRQGDILIPTVFRKGINNDIQSVLGNYETICVYEEHNMDNGFCCYIAQHMAMAGHQGILISKSIKNQLSSVVGSQDYMRRHQGLFDV